MLRSRLLYLTVKTQILVRGLEHLLEKLTVEQTLLEDISEELIKTIP
jgi:hypothetical protein